MAGISSRHLALASFAIFQEDSICFHCAATEDRRNLSLGEVEGGLRLVGRFSIREREAEENGICGT